MDWQMSWTNTSFGIRVFIFSNKFPVCHLSYSYVLLLGLLMCPLTCWQVSTTVKLVSQQQRCYTFHSSFSFLGGNHWEEREKLLGIFWSQPLHSSCPVVAGGSCEVLNNYQHSRNFFSFCSRPAQAPAKGAGLHMVDRVIAFTVFMR